MSIGAAPGAPDSAHEVLSRPDGPAGPDEPVRPDEPAGPVGPGRPRVVFVNGLHRSGTTVMTSAVTEAAAGITTTVGALARHILELSTFLAGLSATGVDRGVDRLPVTAETSEEYGFLLHHRIGTRDLYGHPDGVKLLRSHISELAAAAPGSTVVLKNPWDVGREAQMLADFPEAGVIVVRRRLADIERSLTRALLRTRSSPYAEVLNPDAAGHQRFQRQLASPWRRALLLCGYRLALRRRAYRLARSVRRLPIERVALVSYDELQADPQIGAAWAAHLVDPDALARAFTHHAFAEQGERAPSSLGQRAVDRAWQRAWQEVRQAQLRAGIVTSPAADASVADRAGLEAEAGNLPAQPRAERHVRPVRAGVSELFRLAPQLRQRVEKLLWRGFYEAASFGRRDLGTTLMNYGYAPTADVTPHLSPGVDGFGLELYAAVVGAVDLSGLDVLEVGCGRGGGTAFVFERFGPRSMIGLDVAARAIARCRARYAQPGLTFVAGDAESLPFADASFDVILSVESTHCYANIPRFLREAARVLRPGGLMLLADFRHTLLPPDAEDALVPQEDVHRLRGQIHAAGFRLREEEDITANVVRALQLDTPRRRAQIERNVPRPLRRQALAFAAVEGGPMYEAFADGKWTYLRCAVEKV